MRAEYVLFTLGEERICDSASLGGIAVISEMLTANMKSRNPSMVTYQITNYTGVQEAGMKYKDFPKHDLRRCFTVLMTIERLGERATAHYVSLELECTRAEVIRAIDVARTQLQAQVAKIGSSYRMDDWGVLDRAAVMASMKPVAARESEDARLGSLMDAISTGRAPSSHCEADMFRLTAQLLKTRYPAQSMTLDAAARHYFATNKVKPRPFPQMVSDGLIQDVPRFRHAIENRCAGVRTW